MTEAPAKRTKEERETRTAGAGAGPSAALGITLAARRCLRGRRPALFFSTLPAFATRAP